MATGPLCGETNPLYHNTPGPAGCNDVADPDNAVAVLFSPTTLGLALKKDKKHKSTSAQAQRKPKSSQADAVAKLTIPSPTTIRTLSIAINDVVKLNKAYETSKKPKDEDLRIKNEKVIKDIVKAYGVGLNFVTGLEFSNRDNQSDYAITQGTFITVFASILVHPGFVASVIIHESSHAQRNAELEKAGVKPGAGAEDIWKELKEYEGTQLELDSAAITGITQKEQAEATSLRDFHLKEIEALMGKDTRTEIENGGIDKVRAQFIRRLQSKP